MAKHISLATGGSYSETLVAVLPSRMPLLAAPRHKPLADHLLTMPLGGSSLPFLSPRAGGTLGHLAEWRTAFPQCRCLPLLGRPADRSSSTVTATHASSGSTTFPYTSVSR
jgi:hypothetical protein